MQWEHGELIRRAREKNGLTQRGLALRVGSTDAHISKLEKGRQRGSFNTLVFIAKALEMDVSLLLFKAGFVLVPSMRTKLDIESQEFYKLPPRIKKILLELAPTLQRYLSK